MKVTEMYSLIKDWGTDKKMGLVSLILVKETGSTDLKTVLSYLEEWINNH